MDPQHLRLTMNDGVSVDCTTHTTFYTIRDPGPVEAQDLIPGDVLQIRGSDGTCSGYQVVAKIEHGSL